MKVFLSKAFLEAIKEEENILGQRKETYYTEKELLKLNFNYKYKDLSREEKSIYKLTRKTTFPGTIKQFYQ